MPINWHFPSPRRGLAGVLDRFIGPGATRAEVALQFGVPGLAAIAAPIYASQVVTAWSWLQYSVCCILAFDIAGGVITNATSTAKRWYHRAGQGFKQHLGMVCLHLLHLLIVSSLYLAFDVKHEFRQIKGGRLASPQGSSSGKLEVWKKTPRSTVYSGCANLSREPCR